MVSRVMRLVFDQQDVDAAQIAAVAGLGSWQLVDVRLWRAAAGARGTWRPCPHPRSRTSIVPLVQLDQLFGDRQPEPQAAVRARRADFGLAEALEHASAGNPARCRCRYR